jgi:hypothetical protein
MLKQRNSETYDRLRVRETFRLKALAEEILCRVRGELFYTGGILFDISIPAIWLDRNHRANDSLIFHE